jgi:hypothetical protein
MKWYTLILVSCFLLEGVKSQPIFKGFWDCPSCSSFGIDSSYKSLCWTFSTISITKRYSFGLIYSKPYENAFEAGYKQNSKREGWWNIYDESSNLIAQKFFINDEIVYELHYYRKRLSALIKFELSECIGAEETEIRCLRKLETTFFKRKVRPKVRFTLQDDGSTKVEYLRGKGSKSRVYKEMVLPK